MNKWCSWEENQQPPNGVINGIVEFFIAKQYHCAVIGQDSDDQFLSVYRQHHIFPGWPGLVVATIRLEGSQLLVYWYGTYREDDCGQDFDLNDPDSLNALSARLDSRR